MKTLILTLALSLSALPSFSQKKSKTDPRDAQIDTLTTVNKTLAVQLDSVSKELVKFIGVYTAIEEKILHYNFDPTRAAYLIDSLKASRDSVSAIFTTQPKTFTSADSLQVLLKENTMLKAKIDSINTAIINNTAPVPAEELEKARAISNLKQLKELLDAKIITDAEFLIMKKKYTDKL